MPKDNAAQAPQRDAMFQTVERDYQTGLTCQQFRQRTGIYFSTSGYGTVGTPGGTIEKMQPKKPQCRFPAAMMCRTGWASRLSGHCQSDCLQNGKQAAG